MSTETNLSKPAYIVKGRTSINTNKAQTSRAVTLHKLYHLELIGKLKNQMKEKHSLRSEGSLAMRLT